ncbi:MAG: nucleoid occlusion factor SlmA [Gammaproteobacteria bacterium]|nr:nucleoid occlusion factor SlmA [Gammaproteobacteria bacterium]MDH5630306.1 nucleoid occlusion factor SlmA [Gammaproteobacteria bacterium]
MNNKINRKQDILQNLARMLETDLGDRITTAGLAKEVGVSEAALYRHFPSKAKMFEALLDFCEESIFTRVNTILSSDDSTLNKCSLIASLVLNFSQKNPGLSRLLTAEVLLGETSRLKQRVSQIFDKLEVQIKQLIRNASVASGVSSVDSNAMARLLTALIEGRIQQFVRSNFEIQPADQWDNQWKLLSESWKI